VKRKELIIAIDGPAASGKSTTARNVARRLGYLHIDTGAMYRAFTLKVLREGIDPSDTSGIARIVDTSHVELRGRGSTLSVLLDGEDVTSEIRREEVTRAVSEVSSIRPVRAAMVREQRRLGRDGGVVLEGRDIGTVVFPDADLKIFMVASIEERATRRQRELQEQGVEVSHAKLLSEIRERDRKDSMRTESPLTRAEDAIVLDTSGLSIEEQVQRVVAEAAIVLKEREQA
jgi:cytidylate kinase